MSPAAERDARAVSHIHSHGCSGKSGKVQVAAHRATALWMRVAAVLRNCVAHGIPQGVACVLKVLLCGIGGLIVQSLARVRVVERAEACRLRTQTGSNAVIRRVRPWQRTLAARAVGAPGLGVAAVVLILARRAVSAGAKAEVFASGARTSTARAVRSAVVCTSPEQLERKRRVAGSLQACSQR